MNTSLESINEWLTLIANLGVLAGIIFLAFEVRQNTKASHSESRQAVLTSSQIEILEFFRNPEVVAGIVKQEKLTQEENIRVHFLLTAIMRLREYSWLQYQNRTIDRDQWNTELSVIGIVLSAVRTRKWWNVVGKHQFNPNFANFVDRHLETISVSNDYWVREMTWDDL